MKNIKKHEQSVVDALKTITITDNDGKKHFVPIIYGTPEKAEACMVTVPAKDDIFVKATKIDQMKLPLISIVATEIGKHHIHFDGEVNVMWRKDMNEIAEQLLHLADKSDDFDNITVGSLEIAHKELESNKICVLNGKFVIRLG